MGQGELIPVAARDRDELGRPRNARPRDQAGRPLPRGSPPGLPPSAPVGAASAGAVLRRADGLIRDGLPFLAHEVLEEAWRRGGADRELWRGLAQLAVGLTHLQRGNLRGAAALLRRGAATVDGASPPPGLRLAADLPNQARQLARRLCDQGLPEQSVALRLREVRRPGR